MEGEKGLSFGVHLWGEGNTEEDLFGEYNEAADKVIEARQRTIEDAHMHRKDKEQR